MVISQAKKIVEKNARLQKEGDVELWLKDDIQAMCQAIVNLEDRVFDLEISLSGVRSKMKKY